MRPTSRLGWAAVWVAVAATVVQLALSTVVLWVGMPLGLLGLVLAVVAMARHDHGLLLWLPVVVGLTLAVIPTAFWIFT